MATAAQRAQALTAEEKPRQKDLEEKRLADQKNSRKTPRRSLAGCFNKVAADRRGQAARQAAADRAADRAAADPAPPNSAPRVRPLPDQCRMRPTSIRRRIPAGALRAGQSGTVLVNTVGTTAPSPRVVRSTAASSTEASTRASLALQPVASRRRDANQPAGLIANVVAKTEPGFCLTSGR
jgi:hypothetical protein